MLNMLAKPCTLWMSASFTSSSQVNRKAEKQVAETVLSSVDVIDPREGLELRLPARPFTGHVLLVDDMLDDAALLADLLAPLEASIAMAQSAEEALALVDGQPVDLVITDLNMPGATGLDLA